MSYLFIARKLSALILTVVFLVFNAFFVMPTTFASSDVSDDNQQDSLTVLSDEKKKSGSITVERYDGDPIPLTEVVNLSIELGICPKSIHSLEEACRCYVDANLAAFYADKGVNIYTSSEDDWILNLAGSVYPDRRKPLAQAIILNEDPSAEQFMTDTEKEMYANVVQEFGDGEDRWVYLQGIDDESRRIEMEAVERRRASRDDYEVPEVVVANNEDASENENQNKDRGYSDIVLETAGASIRAVIPCTKAFLRSEFDALFGVPSRYGRPVRMECFENLHTIIDNTVEITDKISEDVFG